MKKLFNINFNYLTTYSRINNIECSTDDRNILFIIGYMSDSRLNLELRRAFLIDRPPTEAIFSLRLLNHLGDFRVMKERRPPFFLGKLCKERTDKSKSAP